MPIFVIHGNHDDPSGDGNLSPIDILSTAGLVNYFGKTASVDDISIVPILLKKGDTRLALYGLGGIRDERLHRTFLQKKVKMLRPVDDDASSWFSMLILHQNRVPHGPTNYIPETFLDDFLDLVVWGHEHESMACDPTECAQRGFMVCQPGSSVATSLCEGEAKRKHAVILKLQGNQFELEPVPLKTVRPFIVKDVALKDATPRITPADSNAINQFLSEHVDQLIENAKVEWSERNSEVDSPLPLVRLRVDCSLPEEEDPTKAYATINPQRFGQQYMSKVANPRDILHYLRRKGGAAAMAAQRRLAASRRAETPEDELNDGERDGQVELRVEDLVSQYLGCQKLDVFPHNEFGDILRTSIEKTDHGLIEKFVNESIGRIVQRTSNVTEIEPTGLKVEFDRVKKLREEEWNRLHPTIDSVLLTVGTVQEVTTGGQEEDNSGDDEVENLPRTTSTRGGRGRGRGATASATRGSTRGRGRGKATTSAPSTKRATIDLVSDEDEVYEIDPPTKQQLTFEEASPGKRSTTGRGKPSTTPTTAWPPRRR